MHDTSIVIRQPIIIDKALLVVYKVVNIFWGYVFFDYSYIVISI